MCATCAALILCSAQGEVIDPRVPSSTLPAPPVVPSVIRWSMIKRPRPKVRLTRKEIFARDGWQCVYCGRATRDLTLDHVVPRHRGGPHTWDNLVAACRSCNHRKAGRTPQEARMAMTHEPGMPRVSIYHVFFPYLGAQEEWRKFVPGWDDGPMAAAL